MSIIDTPWRTTEFLPKLKADGVKTIIRYYNRKNSTKLPEKRLELAEAMAIDSAGMSLCSVYQQGQDSIDDFDNAQGVDAGARAFVYASTVIKQPKGSTIYFSVDKDFVRKSHLKLIDAFFTGVSTAFAEKAGTGGSYAIGAYGSGLVLQRLKDQGLASMFWLAQSKGWTDYKTFLDSNAWNLLQGPVTEIEKLDCDTNESNPEMPSFGEFQLGGPAIPMDVAAAAVDSQLMKVNARDGLNLRQGPGTDFKVLSLLPFGARVYVRAQNGPWSLIDLQGDNKLDGYCFSSFLSRV